MSIEQLEGTVLEQALWIISLLTFVVAGIAGFISTLCVPDRAEEAYWIAIATGIALAACTFALIAMWIY